MAQLARTNKVVERARHHLGGRDAIPGVQDLKADIIGAEAAFTLP